MKEKEIKEHKQEMQLEFVYDEKDIMNELELLSLLQKIKDKINSNQELTENETKLLATILFDLAFGFIEQTTRLLLEEL